MDKWTCVRCGRDNDPHTTVCEECRVGYHQVICQACGEGSLLDPIHVVRYRGSTPALIPWAIKSVGLNSVEEPGRTVLAKLLGRWVCFKCQAVDIPSTEYIYGDRRCRDCNARLRPSNPDFWCELCKRKGQMHRKCVGCGHWLQPDEYRYCHGCAPKRRCPSCNGSLDRLEDTCLSCRSKGLPGLSYLKSMVDERSRPLPPLMVAMTLEKVANLIKESRERIMELVQHIGYVKGRIAKMEGKIRWHRSQRHRGDVTLLEAEIKKERIQTREASAEIDRHREKIRDFKMVEKATLESRTWRTVVPGRFSRPSSRTSPARWEPVVVPEGPTT